MYVCSATFKWIKLNLYNCINYKLPFMHSVNFQIGNCRWILFGCKNQYNTFNFTFSGVFYCSCLFFQTQKINTVSGCTALLLLLLLYSIYTIICIHHTWREVQLLLKLTFSVGRSTLINFSLCSLTSSPTFLDSFLKNF